jgi:hypothetical protein
MSAKHLGIDLWNYRVSDAPLLQKALDYLLPYFLKTDAWPYPQVTEINQSLSSDLLCQAIVNYPQDRVVYSRAYNSLVANRSLIGVDSLMLCLP